jgi:hypothetical protein
MMHLSTVPYGATVTPPKPLAAAQPAYDFVTPPRR